MDGVEHHVDRVVVTNIRNRVVVKNAHVVAVNGNAHDLKTCFRYKCVVNRCTAIKRINIHFVFTIHDSTAASYCSSYGVGVDGERSGNRVIFRHIGEVVHIVGFIVGEDRSGAVNNETVDMVAIFRSTIGEVDVFTIVHNLSATHEDFTMLTDSSGDSVLVDTKHHGDSVVLADIGDSAFVGNAVAVFIAVNLRAIVGNADHMVSFASSCIECKRGGISNRCIGRINSTFAFHDEVDRVSIRSKDNVAYSILIYIVNIEGSFNILVKTIVIMLKGADSHADNMVAFIGSDLIGEVGAAVSDTLFNMTHRSVIVSGHCILINVEVSMDGHCIFNRIEVIGSTRAVASGEFNLFVVHQQLADIVAMVRCDAVGDSIAVCNSGHASNLNRTMLTSSGSNRVMVDGEVNIQIVISLDICQRNRGSILLTFIVRSHTVEDHMVNMVALVG